MVLGLLSIVSAISLIEHPLDLNMPISIRSADEMFFHFIITLFYKSVLIHLGIHGPSLYNKGDNVSQGTTKIRVQFDLNEGGADRLEDLKRMTGLRKRVDVINNALAIMGWVVKQIESGRIV